MDGKSGAVARVLFAFMLPALIASILGASDKNPVVRTTFERDPAAERDLDSRYLTSNSVPRRRIQLSSDAAASLIRFRWPSDHRDRFLIPGYRRYRIRRPGAAPLTVVFFPRNPFDLLPRLVVLDEAEPAASHFVRPALDVVARVSEPFSVSDGILPGGGSVYVSSSSVEHSKPVDATPSSPRGRWSLELRLEERLDSVEDGTVAWRRATFDVSAGVARWEWGDPALGHRVVASAGLLAERGVMADLALSIDVLRDIDSPVGLLRARPIGLEKVLTLARGTPSEVALSPEFGVRSSQLVMVLLIHDR